jgi:hypothetical protein
MERKNVRKRTEKRQEEMTKLEKIARRRLRRAEERRRDGDAEAASFMMYWFGRTQERINRTVARAFAPTPFAKLGTGVMA